MKLLGWKDDGERPLPSGGEASRAGLLADDERAYGRLIDHLTADSPSLSEWREPLRSGRATVILTGQQPALLGGPLYTLYKTLTAVETARRERERGRDVIAAFWCVGDDTDHDEVAFSSWPRPGAAPNRIRDDEDTRGARIGGLPCDRFQPAVRQLRVDWPNAAAWGLLDGLVAPSGPPTWSGFLRGSLRGLLGGEPLLFIDGNDPETIAASQEWLRRFAPRRGAISGEIASLAEKTLREGSAPPLSGEEALKALFVLDGPGRRPLGETEAPGDSAPLAPNVVLRPALQEHLLPVERVVCGAAEIAYRRLLGPVYAAAGKKPAPLMRRFSATFFPPSWAGEEEVPDPAHALEDPDAALEEWARGTIDPRLLADLEEVRSDLRARLFALGDRLGLLDRSLAQVLDSAAGKIDYQVTRVEDAVQSKARSLLYRKDPNLAGLREFLLPRGKPQERSFTLWTPLLWEAGSALDDLRGAVREWSERGERGHALITLAPRGGA